MKKIKQTVSLFLSVVMIATTVFCTGVTTFAEEVDILDYLKYKITDGEVTITDCDESISGDVTIPDTIEGCPVTSIGYSAFRDCKSLTNITIPDSVTFIGERAFYECDSITNITIPNGVASIGEYTFRSCDNLTSITIPDSVTIIGAKAFETCKSLTDIIIPNSVTTIGEGAFWGCDSLVEIVIPDSVITIGNNAFIGCDNLTTITIGKGVKSINNTAFDNCTNLANITVAENNADYLSDEHGVLFNKDKTVLIKYPNGNIRNKYTIPDGVTEIGTYAFWQCSNLTNITIPNSVTTIGNGAFYYYNRFTNITIPDSVTTIGDNAFGLCTNLTNIIIPDSVTTIGSSAFEDCSSIENITIPDSVTYIGESAFAGCERVTKFTVDENNANYLSDESGVLFNKDKTELIQYPAGNSRTEYTIPDSVTTISDGAFDGSKKLVNITISNSVTSIGSYAFYFCENLVNITIPNNVTIINTYTFSYCKNLTNIIIPNTITTINSNAFSQCYKLEKITIPDSVTSIGSAAFQNCSMLKSITVLNPDCSIYDSTGTISANSSIYGYPGSTAEAYATKYNRTFIALDEEDGSTGVFGNLAYEIVDNGVIITGCDETVEGDVMIPDDIEGYPVVAIGADAFSGCASLTEIIIPDAVKTIENNTFSGLYSIEKVVAPGVESIGAQAFYGCASLDTFITFAETLEIADDAFDVSENLTVFVKNTATITAPDTLNIITVSFADGILSFSGEYKSDLYYLFDLVAVMCAYYDDVQYLFFDSFEAVSADEGHIYYYTEDWQRIKFDGTKMTNVKFSVEAFDGEEFRKYSFDELCEKVADNELDNFNLVIEEADGLDKGSVEISLVDQINMMMQRILKALTNLLNKLFAFFRSFGK